MDVIRTLSQKISSMTIMPLYLKQKKTLNTSIGKNPISAENSSHASQELLSLQ